MCDRLAGGFDHDGGYVRMVCGWDAGEGGDDAGVGCVDVHGEVLRGSADELADADGLADADDGFGRCAVVLEEWHDEPDRGGDVADRFSERRMPAGRQMGAASEYPLMSKQCSDQMMTSFVT